MRTRTHVERANRDTVELVAVGADVANIEGVREVIGRGGEALSARLRALDEDGRAALCGHGLYTVLEEGGDHYMMIVCLVCDS